MKKIIENKKIMIPLILTVIVLIGATYAWFTATTEAETTNKIGAGNLELDIISESNTINLENAYPLPDSKGLELTEYEFTIENTGTLDSDYTVYLDDAELEANEIRMNDSYLNYTLNSNTEIKKLETTGENPNRVLETGTIGSKEKNLYKLRIWIDKDADNGVMNTFFAGKIRIEAEQASEVESNVNIKAVYAYDEVNAATKCIIGEETTCQPSRCYKSKRKTSCSMGTIVKYAVNNSEEKYFYVLHDDGETMTLQQRENTLSYIAWYSTKDDNTKGPLTILPLLETATSGWANVSNQTYTMGTTNFNNTNEFTGCSAVGTNVVCNINTYTLPERTAKARMITAQEVISTGCQQNQEDGSADESCPIFMYNYLNQSTLHGGSVDDNADNGSGIYNFGYWTMSANSTDLTGVFHVFRKGFINKYISTATYGARAVVVINK